MTTPRPPRDREAGQIIVLFALALVGLLAMVGLVLDGGSTFAQRRDQQNAADLAALAGANDYLLNSDATMAIAAARAIARQNGYEHGVGGVTVDVTIELTQGARVKVDVLAPHPNTFTRVVGLNSWDVSTTATALTGFPDTAVGAAPFLFSIRAFGTNGQPLPQYGNPAGPFDFGQGNGDVPNNASDMAWTNYGTGNVNTNEVRQIIEGTLVITKTVQFGEYIGQHNNGYHTALFADVRDNLIGQDLPVPVVDDNGYFQGWATFHVTGAAGGSSKDLSGYFVSPFVSMRLTIGACAAGSCPRFLGTPVLQLVN